MAELKKSLGFWTIVALTITSMVGTGMFLGTALGAKYSGNAVLIAWGILMIIGLYVAACFGELISLFPMAGGVYEFSKQAYGRFVSFIIGWTTWIMSNIATTVLIIATLQFLLPPSLNSSFTFAGMHLSMSMVLSIALILLLNFISFLGVDIGAAVLMVFALETVVLFLAIIIPGFMKVNIANFTPFISQPYAMIFVSLFFILESLMGWEAASFLAEETKDAGRVIPKALMVTTFFAGVLGIMISFVSLGVIPWQALASSANPMTDIAFAIFGPGSRLASLVGIGIGLALLGSVVGCIISTPRLLLAMARDKIFISQLAAIHPTRKTPYKAIVFQTIISVLIIIIGGGQYEKLLAMFTPPALLMYISVLMAIPILRHKMPDAKREFKVVFGRIGPVIVSLIYAAVIFMWLYQEPGAIDLFRTIASLIFIGIPIFILMIFFYNPDVIVSFTNAFSRLSLWLEGLLLPRKIRMRILELFSNIEDRTVLEYGAGVGTLTLDISKAVGPRGKVYATDISHRNVHLLKKRLMRRKIANVEPIHDEHQVNRVHPSVNNADIVISVGFMSYMQDVQKILSQINRIMPESGKICFVEYVNYFFGLLPDKEWFSDPEMLKKTFRKAGFSVRIEKKKGLLWSYLFVYGIKSERDVPIV